MMKRANISKIFAFKRLTKQIIQLFADLTLILACFFLAIWTQEGFVIGAELTTYIILLILSLTTLILFEVTGVNKNLIRYISLSACKPIFISSILSAAILLVASELVSYFVTINTIFIYFCLVFLTTTGVRFALHGIFTSYNQHPKKSIAVYGAGAAGRELVHFLQGGNDYKPTIFIDDNESLSGYKISGLLVLNFENAIHYCLKSNIDTVLLAIPSLSQRAKSTILKKLQNTPLKVKSIPGLIDIIEGNAAIYDLRNLAVEDLLGRDPVPPKRKLMSKNIKNKTVLVTGAGGSIGSELCRQILRQSPKHLILFEASEYNLYKIKDIIANDLDQRSKNVRVTALLGSVQDDNAIRSTIKEHKIQTIYHAAAYKHVSIVENNVIESIKNNIFGTFTCTEAAFANNVENFILISTDKAVRPTSIMGATKRIAELICQSYSARTDKTCFSIVRFGNVLGSSGSVIPKFEEQIEDGGPVTVTDKNVTRYFMTVAEASELVIQAGSMATGGEVFILDMGKPIRILELAKNMIRLSGKEPSLEENVPKENGIIEIKISGLQDGEKKYEELLIGSKTRTTQHTRIYSADEFSLSKAEVTKIIRELRSAIQNNDVDRIQLLLKRAPIDYVSARVGQQ